MRLSLPSPESRHFQFPTVIPTTPMNGPSSPPLHSPQGPAYIDDTTAAYHDPDDPDDDATAESDLERHSTTTTTTTTTTSTGFERTVPSPLTTPSACSYRSDPFDSPTATAAAAPPSMITPILRNARPYSSPYPPEGYVVHAPHPVCPDRMSSVSLPAYMELQTAVERLPRVNEAGSIGGGGSADGSADGLAPQSLEPRPSSPASYMSATSSTSSSSPPPPPPNLHSSSRMYPPPQPPTILTPPPAMSASSSASSSSSSASASQTGNDGPFGTGAAGRRPYEDFLGRGQPSGECWIAVESGTSEYRLLVRLPGFQRDSITLATRRKHILHIVADSWERGGGHFERRVSFGYDADLTQVRAQFDGLMLRIVVPRRAVGVGLTTDGGVATGGMGVCVGMGMGMGGVGVGMGMGMGRRYVPA